MAVLKAPNRGRKLDCQMVLIVAEQKVGSKIEQMVDTMVDR